MSDTIVDQTRREWVQRVLGVTFGRQTNEDQAAHRKVLLDRIKVVAVSAGELPREQVSAIVSQADAVKALAESADLMSAETAVEQLEALLAHAAEKQRISEKRKTLLGQVEALTASACAGNDALAVLAVEKEKASAALKDEQPSEEQFAAAERAITAFKLTAEAENSRVAGAAKALLAEVAKLTDPPYANPEALAALKQQREAAIAALADPLPAPQQFTVAADAIAAFKLAAEAEKTRVSEATEALALEAAKLTDPPYAGSDALAALKLEREKVAAALTDSLPPPQQLANATNAIKAFGLAVQAEKTRVEEAAKALVAELQKLPATPFAEGGALARLNSEREKAAQALADALPTPDQLTEAGGAISAFTGALEQEKNRIGEKRRTLRLELDKMTDPVWADTQAAADLKIERDRASTALADELPTPAQFATAGEAIAAFPKVVEAATKRITDKRNALTETVKTLTDLAYAAPAVLATLKQERDKATIALKEETPTGAEMIDAERAIAAFHAAVLAEKTRVEQKRKTLLDQVGRLLDPAWADAAAVKALKAGRDAATEALRDALPTPAQIEAAEKAITAFGMMQASAKQRIIDKRAELQRKLTTLTDPTGSGVDELAEMNAERLTATSALSDETPRPDDMIKAEKAVATLVQLIKQSANLSALEAKRPQAAAAARQAFASFKVVSGNLDVTDKMVADARAATEAAYNEYAAALKAWDDADALPDGTPKKGQQKAAAIESAKTKFWEAQRKRDDAVKQENALFGQKALREAIAHGPLSGESGRPFDDGVAEQLIAGYEKNARLTTGAVKAARTAKYPEVIAASLDLMADLAAGGFADAGGTGWTDPDYANAYAEQLLNMAGDVGPEYYKYLDDYLASGEQFANKPLGDESGMSLTKLSHQRTVAVAQAFVQPDGSTSVTTSAAKSAIGHALYHPYSLDPATPNLNAQIIKTTAFFDDATTGPQANTILQGMTKPKKGAASLVRRSLGKGDTEAVDEQEARVAVVSTMLKSLDQGPVGSCFSTAPARNMREQEPLTAMQAFADIASKGSYQPTNGIKVPAVTKLPAEEDPIMRSWEYTLATSTARTGASSQKTALNNNIGLGLDQLKTIAVDKVPATAKDKAWDGMKNKLKKVISDGFTFNYDPLSTITDSNDGTSSTGRYVVQRVSNKKEITTKDAFIEQMTEIALASLKTTKNSPEETQIKDVIKSDAFINAVCPGKYKPWELASGGQTEAACRTLFGASISERAMQPKAPTSTPMQPEGDRTTDVLNAFINNLGNSTKDMVVIKTVGKHGFNALPNDPSLAPLKGTDASDTAAKIQTNLIDKGQTIKDTDLSAERAAWLFDQEMQKAIDGQSDLAMKELIRKGAQAKRPTAAMKPQALTTAVKEAFNDFHTAVADRKSKAWEQSEISASRTVDAAAVLKKKNDLKAAFDTDAGDSAKTTLIQDLGAPEFVIADTNWGDSEDHTFFVIAPDPATGEPALWKKNVPPGSMTRAGRDWVDAEWASIN